MVFEKIKNISYKSLLWLALALILIIGLLFFLYRNIDMVSKSNQDIFAYSVKVRNTVESLDKVFERAEVNVNVMADSISNSYNINKQQDKAYNLQYVEGINGLIKSVLSNSPGVDGSWFQLNADLPFSGYAYNWYEFKDNQFVDIKGQFEGTPSIDRKITPEDDPYYFEAVMNQKPCWSDIYTDADTKQSMTTISAPIYKEGVLVGVVGIDISVDNLQQILKDMQSVLGESELYLLDKKGKVILSQLPSAYPVKDNYVFLSLFNGNFEGPAEYYEGIVKKTAIKLTLSNDYKIVISIKNNVLYRGTAPIINVIYILFGLLIILAIIMFINYLEIIRANMPKIVEIVEKKAKGEVKPEAKQEEFVEDTNKEADEVSE